MIRRFARLERGGRRSWGVIEGDQVQPVQGDIWGSFEKAGSPVPLAEVKLLAPAEPRKIFCVGLNYRSHLGGRPAPERPEIFYKPSSCLQDPEGPIIIPKGAENVHYESELVVMIGKPAKHVSPEEAADAIFAVTCGNDVSERDWQHGEKRDLQWWRAKGSDTFAPLGPVLVAGLDYNHLMLEGRLNGEVVQKQNTSDLMFNPAVIVSHISQAVTLEPGDLIYTGTPGATRKMQPGDVFEVELEGVGILRNPVKAA